MTQIRLWEAAATAIRTAYKLNPVAVGDAFHNPVAVGDASHSLQLLHLAERDGYCPNEAA
ncbi:MAG TPA: hypothetical protein VMX74_05990 [Pirellulales bacterium]|nr:hypothetical protein [Pirellulales bacterium]